MIPILFNSNETDFTKNGIGRLFPISCLVGEERNGAYEMELVINEEAKYFSQIELGSLIGAQVSDGSMQLFRVYAIEKDLEEVSLKCQHISYDLSYIPVSPFVALSPSEAMSKISQYSVVTNPFTFITDKVSDVRFEQLTPKSARAILGGEENSLLDVYGGGEYKFDNRIVTLYAARGEDKGITIRYGKNLTDLTDDETNENAIDGLLPYWTDGSISVTGSIIRANMGNKIITEDISGDITLEEGQTQPTVDEVNTAGANHLKDKIVGAERSIKVSWYENNSISDVALCDTVNVIYEPYNINVKMKVVKTIWNVVEEHYESVELGEYKSLAKTLSSMSNQIDNINYNNGITHIRLEKTEDAIVAEVTRATAAEDVLSTQIVVAAEGVMSTVAANMKEWDTFGYNITLYGYEVPTSDEPSASEHTNEFYLNQATGIIYRSNGTAWVQIKQCESKIDQTQSQITQTASEIKQEVAASQKVWDTESYNIAVAGYGTPTHEGINPQDYPYQYYLDVTSGGLYYSGYDSWTFIKYFESVENEIRGELAVKISNTDDGTIVSLLTGSANYIQFGATNMFTVNAPNFTVDHSGNISANNADLKGTTNFLDANGNTLGYIGSSVLGGGGYGIGLRNASDNTGIAFANYGDGYLWFKSNNNTMVLAGSNLRPNSDGGLDLGSSSYHWDWIACNHISCVDQPWSTSDKRLKNVKGYIDNVKEFYMALNPIEYTFKEGVAYEDTEKMHYGLIAQDLLEIYEKCYNTDKQGLVKREEVLEDSTKELLGEDFKYSINYNELHAFHIKMIQSLVEEVQALKDENNRLSVKIDEIERRIK